MNASPVVCLTDVLKGKLEQGGGSLDIARANLGPSSGKELGGFIRHRCANLRALSLEGNPLGDVGTSLLCHELGECSASLMTLNVRECLIGDSGVAALSVLLRQPHCALTSVDMSRNELTPVGMRALCDALATNTGLMHLNLDLNGLLEDSAAEQLASLIQKSSTLTRVSLRCSNISDSGATLLKNAVLKTRRCVVDCRGANIHHDLAERLQMANDRVGRVLAPIGVTLNDTQTKRRTRLTISLHASQFLLRNRIAVALAKPFPSLQMLTSTGRPVAFYGLRPVRDIKRELETDLIVAYGYRACLLFVWEETQMKMLPRDVVKLILNEVWP
jgi:Leucine Rich repeat